MKFSPLGPVDNLQCPEGQICIDGQCSANCHVEIRSVSKNDYRNDFNTMLPERNKTEIVLSFDPDEGVDEEIIFKERSDGLFEFLKEGTLHEYNPLTQETIAYELTEEDHRRFDSMDGRREEIEIAKKVFAKMKGNVQVSCFDTILKSIEDIWYDTNKKQNEDYLLLTSKASIDLYNEAIKREYEQSI